MLGILSHQQCERVLRNELVGRIGCSTPDRIYIVPVTYVFVDNYIYIHSKEGLKIQILRKNPRVCFEVESIQNLMNWRTVIVLGMYEELKSAIAQNKATKILNDHLSPYLTSESVKPLPYYDPPRQIEKKHKPIFYRLSVQEVSGRFEKSY